MALPSHISGVLSTGAMTIAYKIHWSAKRRRTISFFMESSSMMRVMAPARLSPTTIITLLHKKLPWIAHKAREMQERAPSVTAPNQFCNGDDILYLGYRYKLALTFDPTTPRGCSLRPHSLTVNLHDSTLSSHDLRDEVRLEILLWMKKRARIKFEKRLQFWAHIMGTSYRKMVISSPQRRWGSCTHQNVLRLNWRLIMAPQSVLDYVLVHELCHIRHKDHSPRFWAFLATFMPDYKNRQKILNAISPHFTL